MKKCFGLLLFVVLLVPIVALGQITYTTIEAPAAGGPTYLNAFVSADSANWQAGNTVYVLRKGGVYAWNASITVYSSAPTARIEFQSDYASANADPDFYPDQHLNPIIFMYPTATGGGAPAGQIASIAAPNFTFKMKNISWAAWNQRSADDTTYFRLANTSFIQSAVGSSSTTRLIFDTCMFQLTAGQMVRTNGPVGIVKFTNCIAADHGHRSSNFGAGKFIDARNVKVDTIQVENCTIINMWDRVIRHLTATKVNCIGNFIFNHNTIVNSMSYHGFLSLGTVDSTGAGTFQIKNNLLLDHFALGMDTAVARQLEFADPGELDRYGRFRMAWVLTNPNSSVPWDIQKNYYAVSDSGQAILNLGANPAYWGPKYQSVDQDTIGGDPNDHNYLTRKMNAVLATQGKDTLNTFTKLTTLKFQKCPTLMTPMLRWVLLADPPGDGKNKPTLNSSPSWFANGMPSFELHKLEYYADTLNMSFRSNTNLATAGTDGKVIGDTRWSYLGTVGVNEVVAQVPLKYSLHQNYPNPFNPSTSFTYELSKAGLVSVKVFDLLGREVATLVNEFKPAGSYPAIWNASGFGSGVYFYKMQSGSFTATKKMILMK
jgi:hypothetical protein